MSTFSFFELHTPDVERARAFYGALFGWKFEPVSKLGPQLLLSTTEGHAGALLQDARNHWLNYITVPDCLASAAKVKELGGKILGEKVTIPDAGAFVVVADPSGTPFALWQEAAR